VGPVPDAERQGVVIRPIGKAEIQRRIAELEAAHPDIESEGSGLESEAYLDWSMLRAALRLIEDKR
jgi:hypothetical protein